MTLSTDVLGWVKTNWPDGSFPGDLERVDRNDSEQLEGGVQSLTNALEQANFVGARDATRDPSPAGFSYDEQTIEAVVGVRVIGLVDNNENFGHIADHDAFLTLVENIQTSILEEREYPTTSTAESYCTLFVENEADLSSNYRDYYRYDFDVRFADGYKSLP